MTDDDIITIRLPRSRAEFLELNIATMLERTREAVSSGGPDERRVALGKRIVMLAVLDDAIRGALIDCNPPKDRPGLYGLGSAVAAIQAEAEPV